MSNYIPLFNVDVIVYSSPYSDAGLANLHYWMKPPIITPQSIKLSSSNAMHFVSANEKLGFEMRMIGPVVMVGSMSPGGDCRDSNFGTLTCSKGFATHLKFDVDSICGCPIFKCI